MIPGDGAPLDRHPPDALGLESRTVRVVPYDPRWAALFRDEAARLTGAFAAAGVPSPVLEHVGSTAVPGLAAKPILDIAAGRPADLPATVYVPVLEAAGYVYRGNGGLPGREFFRRGQLRSHHMHLVELGGAHWERYLRFRDRLRADAALREAYSALKNELAVRFPRNREAYIEGKANFVEAVLRARGTS